MNDAQYEQEIVEMVKEVNTPKFIRMIYGFVRAAHREEAEHEK